MRTYSELASEYEGKALWDCDATIGEEPLADVLVYDTKREMDADDDNSLAIHRETVIDDREY